jgi:hypothetical protein
MEDIELRRRLGKKGRYIKVRQPIKSSARRFRRNGFFWQLLLDVFILGGWYLGASPTFLYKFYSYDAAKSK